MSSGPGISHRLEQLERITERVLWAALVGMVAGMAYLVYALASGDGTIAAFNRLPPSEQLQVFGRLRVACQLFTYASWLALTALAIRSWHASEWGYAALIGGGLCQLALPQLLRFAILQQGGASSAASALIVATFRDAGSVALIVGSGLAARDLVERLTARRLQARVAASRATSPPRVRNLPLDEKQDRFLGKCWELPMCRPAIKHSCPVFLRGKQPCWRIGVGCMCSEEVLIMAARTRGEDLTASHESGGTWKPKLVTLDQLASTLTPGQKRERCMNCAIYLHHQSQKYRALLPVTIAGVAALMAALLPWLHTGFVTFAHAADRIAGPLSMPQSAGPETHPALREWSGRLAEAYVAEWILFLCLGVVVLSYALRGLEYAITRRGW